MKKIKPTLLPGIAWFIVSTILLTLPGSSFPKEDWLGKIWFDKWVHIGLFGILVIGWCWGWQRRETGKERLKKAFIVIALFATVYGIGMEFVQKYFIPNRSFDPGDIVADAVGSFGGLLFSLRRYIKK